jgi:hypothetical protein
MPANHQASTLAGVTSSLTLAAEVFAQCEAGKEVASEKSGITVGGEKRNQDHLVQGGDDTHQQAHLKALQLENNRLLHSVAILVKELRCADQEARKTAAMLRAVAAEVREVMEPYREMYKDSRLVTVKADAIRKNVPEVVVDTIIREFCLEGFPTIGTLTKNLYSSGSIKTLTASGHGTARATIARWLQTVRKFMVSNGVIEKYRVRIADLPVHPYDQIHHPASEDENQPDESAGGMTKRDTRSQELGNDYSDPAD